MLPRSKFWYRRYGRSFIRPRPGCGCLYVLLLLALLYWLLALVFPVLRLW
ncbi:MAG: hypothetical protein KatS3mg057_3034 [Herpetosiphonaceae bacterium]|nr:MAG: hypothetical protein KatS3mg057_3034 [Herpetosiphonaceae bacterium]